MSPKIFNKVYCVVEGVFLKCNYYRGRLSIINSLIEYFFPKVKEDIMNSRCPFCGRKFRTRGSLASHLKHGRCGDLFRMVVESIAEAYLDVKDRFRFGSMYKDGVHVSSGGIIYFRSMRDVVEWIRSGGVLGALSIDAKMHILQTYGAVRGCSGERVYKGGVHDQQVPCMQLLQENSRLTV